MKQLISQEDFVARLDGWIGQEVAIRMVGDGDELLAVFQGQLGERSDEKEPALFWPLPRVTRAAHAEKPGIYLHPERFERAAVREGKFVLELGQAGATLNIRLL
jgi:hypothetical protein